MLAGPIRGLKHGIGTWPGANNGPSRGATGGELTGLGVGGRAGHAYGTEDFLKPVSSWPNCVGFNKTDKSKEGGLT